MSRSLKSTSTAELIAIATGRKGTRGHADAHRLANKIALKDLAEAGVPEIQHACRNLSERSVLALMAGVEIGLRIAEEAAQYGKPDRIIGPDSAIAYCKAQFGRMAREAKQEECWVVTLNTKNEPIGCHQVTVGTLRNSLVHPREIFRPAIKDAANCILFVHNHPSGDCTPSEQDWSVKERLEAAGEMVGIPVLDAIIVGGQDALSMNATGR